MIIKLAKNLAAIIFLLFIAIFIFAAVTCESNTDAAMDDIHNKVSDDAVEQYNIAKKQGDAIQTCVQAGLVSAAYLQAKDEVKYNEWKAVEKQDCKVAGL